MNFEAVEYPGMTVLLRPRHSGTISNKEAKRQDSISLWFGKNKINNRLHLTGNIPRKVWN